MFPICLKGMVVKISLSTNKINLLQANLICSIFENHGLFDIPNPKGSMVTAINYDILLSCLVGLNLKVQSGPCYRAISRSWSWETTAQCSHYFGSLSDIDGGCDKRNQAEIKLRQEEDAINKEETRIGDWSKVYFRWSCALIEGVYLLSVSFPAIIKYVEDGDTLVTTLSKLLGFGDSHPCFSCNLL